MPGPNSGQHEAGSGYLRHERCLQGLACQGYGCRIYTGKTARKRRAKERTSK